MASSAAAGEMDGPDPSEMNCEFDAPQYYDFEHPSRNSDRGDSWFESYRDTQSFNDTSLISIPEKDEKEVLEAAVVTLSNLVHSATAEEKALRTKGS
ncbi:unnamed protein product [Soboliphyme baturini]|uniref:Endosome-associated-trafficking regulator 1 n=1 Tax=Soboliphyme baturini TaxID=241478 RepID=A0A183J496_9BILA|nr:unnamed protein product [Soboliphyme baturini]